MNGILLAAGLTIAAACVAIGLIIYQAGYRAGRMSMLHLVDEGVRVGSLPRPTEWSPAPPMPRNFKPNPGHRNPHLCAVERDALRFPELTHLKKAPTSTDPRCNPDGFKHHE